MKIEPDKYKVKPHKSVKLSKVKTTSGFKTPDTNELTELLANDIQKIAKLQYKLYAENRQALLIVLQGIDGSGKDGTIRNIMSGVNPQGVDGVFNSRQVDQLISVLEDVRRRPIA